MARIEAPAEEHDQKHQADQNEDPPSRKRLKIDTPCESSPMPPSSESTTASPLPETTPPPPTQGQDSDDFIEKHFRYYFDYAYIRLEDPNSDFNIPVSTAIKALKGITAKAQEYFINEYLHDIYVFINSIHDFQDFSSTALTYPSVRGRIKFDQRNGVHSDAEWEKDIPEVLDLIRGEFPLTKDRFKNLLLANKPFPLSQPERRAIAEEKRRNPLGKHASSLPVDLKALEHRGNWAIAISCDSVLENKEVKQFQVWGDIGRLTRLWKSYAPGGAVDGGGSESSGGEESDAVEMNVNSA
jgi:hypothetical protein